MIRSGSVPGLAFGHERDGDGRSDRTARASIAGALGIADAWATVRQVHGTTIAVARAPGDHGEADGIVTDIDGLPITVATADCMPIALAGTSTIGLVHAGWRGLAAGVIEAGVATMRSLGDDPRQAVIGPHIGSCCYEVGDEVIEAVGGFRSATRQGTTSVDLAASARERLSGIPTETIDVCTMDDPAYASFRETATSHRQVTVVWLT